MTAFLVYGIITLVAALLCLWTGVSAAPRIREHRGSHRLVTGIGATLLLPAAGAPALATALGFPELAYGTILLPVAVMCCTWSNVITMRDQGWSLKLLHLPTFLFNTLLLGLYTVRVVQDFLGQDLGTWGGAVTIAHVSLQTQVGQASAAANPVWFHLPFLLPLCLRFRWYHVVALTFSSAVSMALLYLLVAAMPMAHVCADSYRHAGSAEPRQIDRGHGSLAVKLPWGHQLLPTSTRRQIREALRELRPHSVTIDVGANTFDDDELHEQVKRELAWAKEQAMPVTVICTPSPSQLPTPETSLVGLGQQLARTQLLAASLEPDLVVLFSGPFGRLAALTVKTPSIDEWVTAIAQAAGQVRQSNPRVKVGVTIESIAPRAGELFRRLRAPDSPVDIVGLAIFRRQWRIQDLDKDLSRLRRLVERSPGSRPVQILETGCTPHAVGGELGQWNFLRRILALAADIEGIDGVCIDALHDLQSTRGLLTWTGRRRLAFQELRATAAQPR